MSVFLFVFVCVLLQPFGVNQPGPYVMYTTVDSNGYLKNASGKYFFNKCLTTVAFTSYAKQPASLTENSQRGIYFSENVTA